VTNIVKGSSLVTYVILPDPN